MSTHHNLQLPDQIALLGSSRMLTKTPLLAARTLPSLPGLLFLGAMRVRVMLVPNLVPEMYLLLLGEQSSCDTMYGCVAPTLKTHEHIRQFDTPKWHAPHSKTRPYHLDN